jgi:hypothetical protein
VHGVYAVFLDEGYEERDVCVRLGRREEESVRAVVVVRMRGVVGGVEGESLE